jgi:hypothetical protein
MDEWLLLRTQGVATPSIAMWCNSPVSSYSDGHQTTWQWLLDHVYNNATRAPLLFRRPSQTPPSSGQPLKMTFFVPQNGFHNATVDALIAANGGRNNIEVSGGGGECASDGERPMKSVRTTRWQPRVDYCVAALGPSPSLCTPCCGMCELEYERIVTRMVDVC